MPIGLAVVISTASLAIRSAFSSISLSSATSQPPVFGTPTKLRVLVTSPTFAETLNCGVISKVSCSMYEPFARREVFPLVVDSDRAVTLLTPFTFDGGVDHFLDERLFVLGRNRARILLASASTSIPGRPGLARASRPLSWRSRSLSPRRSPFGRCGESRLP